MFIAQGAKEDKDIKSEKHPLKVIFFHYIVLIVYRSKKYNFQEIEEKKISCTQREFLDEKRKKKEFAVNIHFQIKEKLLHH